MNTFLRLLLTCAVVFGLTGTVAAQEQPEVELIHWPLYIGATNGPEAQYGVVPTAFYARITDLLPNAQYFFGPSGGAYGFLQEGTTATRGSRWFEEEERWVSPSTVGNMGTADAEGTIERWFWIRPPSDFAHAEDYRVRLRFFRPGLEGHIQLDDQIEADLKAIVMHEDAPSGFEGAWITGDVGLGNEGYVVLAYENVSDTRPLMAWLVPSHDIGQDGDRGGDIVPAPDEESPRPSGIFVLFAPANTSIGRIEIRDEVTAELIAAQNSTEWETGEAGSVTDLGEIQFTTSADPDAPGARGGLSVEQSYPNPLSGQARIAFTTSQAGDVAVHVYNVLGQHVATLLDGHLPAGAHTAEWDGRNAAGEAVAGGIYFYTVRANGDRQTRSLTVVR